MRKEYCLRSIFGLMAGLFIAIPSYGADQTGWFFGLSLARPGPYLEVPGIRFANRDDNGHKLSAGYRFGPYWKAELNYVDLAKPISSVDSLSSFGSLATRGKGLQIAGTASLPLTKKIGVFGKLGASSSNLEGGCMTSILTCAVTDRGADLSYGVGLRYDFTTTVSVRGEWERFRRFGRSDAFGETDRDFFSVGLGFKF